MGLHDLLNFLALLAAGMLGSLLVEPARTVLARATARRRDGNG